MRDPYDHPTFDDLEPEGDAEDAFGEGGDVDEDTRFDLPLSDIEDEPHGEARAQLEAFERPLKPARRPSRQRERAPAGAQSRVAARQHVSWFDDEHTEHENDFEDDLLDEDEVLGEHDPFTRNDLATTSAARREGRAAGLKEDAALLNTLSRRLARSRNATEVASLIGAMVPTALRAHPHAYGGLWRLTPDLTLEMTRAALRQPHLARTLSTGLARVTARLARYVQQGQLPTAAHVRRVVELELKTRTSPGEYRRKRR